MMALFSVSFILFYHRRQSEVSQEKRIMKETYQRELLQSQLETQNQTLEYVGQELHDNIGQMLSVAMLHLNGLEEELAQSAHQSTVRRMVESIEGTITAVRQLSKTLDKSTVKRFGLTESLNLELERIRQTGRYQTNLQVLGQPYALSDESGIILFRMAQESLNNALKHARAKSLTIEADYQPDAFSLSIADDGQGFDQTEVVARKLSHSGSGLHNLHQRAQLLGGTCTIDSQPGAGTRVCITLPHQPAQ
jgi:signal transduction histidine kinase